ncbi:MAG TPA: T9SS type A sorting domain-containing protein [Crocinitomicaceae bacterium]|nr:T9SS type A sorting domain-containing protein [Crocinitomicaceae bacterium]
MKKSLLSLSIFVAGYSFAQNTFTQANEPTNGTYNLFVCDSAAPNYKAIAGANVTWDYSELAKIDGATQAMVIDTVIGNTEFPDATKSVEISGLMTDFLLSSATERQRTGTVLEEASLGAITIKYDAPATIISYPFAYNDGTSNAYSGTIDVPGILPNNPATGKHSSKYDGHGTLIVGNDTVANVSRLYLVDTIATSTPFGDMEVIMEQFEYYDLDNENEPVFIHITMALPLGIQSIVLSKYEPINIWEPDTLSTNKLANVDFKLAPNPVKDELNIFGSFETADVQIIDQTGKIVFNGVASNGTVVSTASLNNGIYMVKMTVNGISTTQKMVKL